MKNKSLRDFFYDKNDIVLALVVIVVAALLIWWRMNVIMDYPQTLAEETKTTEAQTKEDEAVNDSENLPIYTDGKLTKDIQVTIKDGSAKLAVECLVKAGLFKNYDEFAKICNAAGVKVSKIKAATFTFQAGSTQSDIAVLATR